LVGSAHSTPAENLSINRFSAPRAPAGKAICHGRNLVNCINPKVDSLAAGPSATYYRFCNRRDARSLVLLITPCSQSRSAIVKGSRFLQADDFGEMLTTAVLALSVALIMLFAI